MKTEEIPAYCAVALAGLGNLPDTVASRSILIEMRPRAPDELIESYRHRLHAPQAAAIRDLVARWCDEIAPSMEQAQPEIAQGVDDRDADCWEPLIAIADAAGGEWPSRARAAALNLVARASEQTQTIGVQLLADLYSVFGGVAKLWTETILNRLQNLPESPWADIKGKPLTDRGLASKLRKYGVKSRDVRIGGDVRKGYLAADLHDAWKRYVVPICQNEQQARQGLEQESAVQDAAWKPAENREEESPVAGVADVAAFPEGEEDPYRFEERAAILEYDGGLTREEADARAAEEIPDLPPFLDRRAPRAP